jgi:OFA family oxalate/formate antiporter-like MFS transporter
MTLGARLARIHYGWVVVAATFAVLFLTYGAQYGSGLFFAALVDEFGWSRTSLSGVFSVYGAAYSFLGLVSGRLTDRWGPRRVVALGGVFLGSGLALSGAVRSLGPLYATYGVAAIGMSAAYVPCTSTVVRWFTARRGLAAGIAIGGAGVGIFACPPLIALLIEHAGWRRAYALLGAGLAVALAGLSLLLVREPAALGRLPYGGLPAPPQREPAGDWPLGRVLRHRPFVALVGVYLASWTPIFLPMVHLVPFARDLGLSAVVAATSLSALGTGSIVGRLAFGLVSDPLGRRPTLGLALALEACAFGGLALAGGAPALLMAAGLYGFAYGAVTTLLPAILADFYGPTHAGTLVGFVVGVAGPPAALGPVMGGVIFDATGSYRWAFVAAAALNVLALGILALVRPPARPRAPAR